MAQDQPCRHRPQWWTTDNFRMCLRCPTHRSNQVPRRRARRGIPHGPQQLVWGIVLRPPVGGRPRVARSPPAGNLQPRLRALNMSLPTICRCCGEPMAPGTERPPSGGNPNQCVPCACYVTLPPAYSVPGGIFSLPSVTDPAGSERSDAEPGGGSATAPAGGNPFPEGRWT